MTNQDQDSAAGQSTSGTGASGGNEVVIVFPRPDESSGDEELATPMFSSTPIGQLPIAAGEEKRAKAFVESLYGKDEGSSYISRIEFQTGVESDFSHLLSCGDGRARFGCTGSGSRNSGGGGGSPGRQRLTQDVDLLTSSRC